MPDKNHIFTLVISLTVFAILTVMYLFTNIIDGMERGSTDFKFFLRDPSEKSVKLEDGVRMSRINPRARKELVILGIDENTLTSFQNQKPRIAWPFPWDIHAKFINYVATGNPAIIFFDIMFLDHKDKQEELADAVKKAGNVYLDFPFDKEDRDVKPNDINERIAVLDKVKFPADPSDKKEEIYLSVTPPTPLLSQAARGIGFANVEADPRDNINRKMPLVTKYNGWYYPNIDLLIVMDYYGLTVKDLEIKIGKHIKLKNVPEEKMARPDKSREITIPIDDYGFMDINFIGGSGSFQHYPYFLFVKDGTMGKNTSLKDKIVMVAAYASVGIATDEHKSPYGATYGIEHHANALNTILSQEFLHSFTDLQNIFVMFIISLLIGLLIHRFSIGISLLTTLLMAAVFFVTSFLLFYYGSLLIATATPMIQIALTFSMVVSYRFFTEQKEKKYIRQTFSKFVSKTVVDDLLKHPEKLKLGGEKKILTVLFSDIRGFTSISEKLTPEELVEHLNVYLQAMTDIVFRYDGTLDKYVGDEIMAFWGAPVPQDDHALKACKAAIEMMKELHEMNAKWIAAGKPKLEIGIGLNTGDMVVGNMGSSSRMDYTLMGDNVNLGARLEGTNKVYTTNIIISEYTYQHVKDHVIVRELDLIRVKGKAKPVTIYELIGIRD
jgi:adenylate cyclase